MPVGTVVMVYMLSTSAVMIGSKSCIIGAMTRQKAPPSPWCSAEGRTGVDDTSTSIL